MRHILTLSLLLSFAQASLAQLSGPLSGTLGPGTFHVVDTIWVNSGDSLRLLPPTTFTFDGPYPFKIWGTLLAEGTVRDSVVFITEQSDTNRWRGLRFLSSSSSGSRLAYCLIEKGYATGDWLDCHGGGAYCYSSSPRFTNCTITGNRAYFGGGVYCYSSSPSFENCTISGNSGGGAGCGNGSPTFTNCTITGNRADFGAGVRCGGLGGESTPTFMNCTISRNNADVDAGGVYCGEWSGPTFTNCSISENRAVREGGGIKCGSSGPTFTNCTFTSNSADCGGGVYCWWGSAPTFTSCAFDDNIANEGGAVYCADALPSFANCTFSGNSADYGGGGVYCAHNYSPDAPPTFANCTFIGNSTRWGYGGGVYCGDYSWPAFVNCTISESSAPAGSAVYCLASSPTFTRCTLSANSALVHGAVFCAYSLPTFNSTVIAFSNGSGIHFYASPACTVEHCDIFANGNQNIVFEDNNPSQGPPGIGQISTTNANADSCDTYSNIFLDPMFEDTAAGDFHLLAESPCIDAGDPTLPFDPDSTIADIGAFYYHQSATEPAAILLPTVYALHPNWPNPFNSSTMIRYDVPTAGKVSLAVFNLLGQKVATLFDGRQLAGSHTINWSASNLPSGLYFCRMDAAGFAQTRKMILLK